MIESINLSTCATFTGEPQRMDDLRPINYVFGLNGTGKTTIARVIKEPSMYPECALGWLDGTPLTALVYNRDFVDANFRASPVIKGVFTLGEEHAEARERLERAEKRAETARKRVAGLAEQLKEKQSEQADALRRLQDACWAIKADYADEFKDAMRGFLDSKKSFAERVMRQKDEFEGAVPDRSQLRDRFSSVFDKSAETIPLAAAVDGDVLGAVEADPAFERPILGSADVPLADLISELRNSDWVKQGQSLLEKAGGRCPFCQQPEPEHLREHLRAYFDESFERHMNGIRREQTRYRSAASAAEEAAQQLTGLASRYVDAGQVEALRQRLIRKLAGNQVQIEAKLVEPSRAIHLESTAEEVQALNALVGAANERIREHNRMVGNQQAEREVVAKQVWGLIVEELRRDLDAYAETSTRLGTAMQKIGLLIDETKSELKEARREADECEKSMTGVGPTIEAINAMLESLGFTSFALAPGPDPDTYQLVRADGTDATDTLSEGERSFITFLYFFFLVEGSQEASGISGDRVVVVDDPVSSLDGDVLFVVSTLVRDIAEKVRDPNSRLRQLFLLTHNVFFHREVSFSSRRNRDVPFFDEAFWTVRKRGGVSSVERCEASPVRTSYELLWEPVRKPDDNIVGLQNAMRRILENYFRMVGENVTELERAFEGRERIVCRSLLSWLHVGSHHAMDDLWVAPEDGMETHLRVFREIFDRTGHGAHYEKMTAA